MLIWSVFFNFTKMFVIIVTHAYFIHISQGIYGVETHTIITLLQIVHRVWQWKNFENWTLTGKDIDKSKVPRFLWPTL